MPRILFRADAHRSIGTGDLMSVIYLSQYFSRRSWECYFMTRAYEPALRILRGYKLKRVTLLRPQMTIKEEIEGIQEVCKRRKIDCLFMEITDRSMTEYEALGQGSPVKVCVNFDGQITAGFDLVINWAVGSANGLYDRRLYPETRYLIGFGTVPLPASLRTNGNGKRKRNDEMCIFVSMGGADEFNLTRRVLAALSALRLKASVRVVLGAGYDGLGRLNRFLKLAVPHFTLKRNVRDMASEYKRADLAVSAGGLMSVELATVRIPTLLISAYPHQRLRCEYLHKKSLAYYLGDKDDIDAKDIRRGLAFLIQRIERFRSNLSRFRMKGGAERIFNEVNRILLRKRKQISDEKKDR